MMTVASLERVEAGTARRGFEGGGFRVPLARLGEGLRGHLLTLPRVPCSRAAHPASSLLGRVGVAPQLLANVSAACDSNSYPMTGSSPTTQAS
jgi:hypothetical protein